MPTIRIEEDVFEGLKKLAVPFTDTPNSVIRRLLIEKRILPETPATAASDTVPPVESPRPSATGKPRILRRTPQPIYEQFLLYVLANHFDGEADKNDLTKAVIALMKSHGLLNSLDEVRVSTGETKAENTVAWARNALKERGLIRRDSPRGVWALTAQGMKEGKKIDLPQKD